MSHPAADLELENPIERLAAALQRLPSEVRWLCVAAQAHLIAYGQGLGPQRGPWERRGRRLILIANRLRLERPLSAAANIFLLLVTFFAQYRVKAASAGRAPLFIGIQALRESDLMRQFTAMQRRPVLQIDERRLANFFEHGRVSLGALLVEMLKVWRETWRHLGRSDRLGAISRIDAVNILTMHGHRYAYLRAWFRAYLRHRDASPVIAFSAAGSGAFAAVAVGAQAIYMLHGFQRRSLVYPEFSQCVCFTAFEAAHVQRRLPHCTVMLEMEPERLIATTRTLAVAGGYEKHGCEQIEPVIRWARANNMPVVVRRHPADDTGYWDKWRGAEGVKVLDGQSSFVEFIEDVRPCFLASWYSTTMLDALLKGVVPITVSDDQFLDIVFPLREIVLRWSEEPERAQFMLDNADARMAFILEKLNYVLGEGAFKLCDQAISVA